MAHIRQVEPWLREAAEADVDPLKVLEYIFHPGSSVIMSGERGGGKSHCIIGLNELNVKLHPGSFLFSNIIFNQVSKIDADGHIDWTPRVWPEGVIHVTSLEKTFRLTGEILEKKNDWMEDDDFCLYQLKDEFQNFVMADKSYAPLVQAYYIYEGNLRKVRHCDQKVTPSEYNIPKRLRRFTDDITYAGYLSAHIHKEKFFVEDFNQCWGTRLPPQLFATVRIGYDHKEELLEVPTLNWNKPMDLLEEGDIIYDHLSSATFRLTEKPTEDPKDDFDFQGLIDAIGGVSSVEVPTAINTFFEKMDREDAYDKGMDRNYEMCVRVRELLRLKQRKGLKITWDDIARIESKKRTWVWETYRKYAPQLDLDLVEMEELQETEICNT